MPNNVLYKHNVDIDLNCSCFILLLQSVILSQKRLKKKKKLFKRLTMEVMYTVDFFFFKSLMKRITDFLVLTKNYVLYKRSL